MILKNVGMVFATRARAFLYIYRLDLFSTGSLLYRYGHIVTILVTFYPFVYFTGDWFSLCSYKFNRFGEKLGQLV